MIREFVDRKTELGLLEEEWKKPGGRLIILYGRRRIGKTPESWEMGSEAEGRHRRASVQEHVWKVAMRKFTKSFLVHF
ncbi:MAG: hypothetical protein WBJ52_05445 [Methanoregulaceae archaeon]